MSNPRFCLKNGRIFWSRSPNAEEFELADEKPFDGQIVTVGALRAVVHEHHTGTRKADLHGATLEPDCIRAIQMKLDEESLAFATAAVTKNLESTSESDKIRAIEAQVRARVSVKTWVAVVELSDLPKVFKQKVAKVLEEMGA